MVARGRKVSFSASVPIKSTGVADTEAAHVSLTLQQKAGALRRKSLPAKGRRDRRKSLEVRKHLERVKVPRPSVLFSQSNSDETNFEAMSICQRKPCKLFRSGDTVELWSVEQQRWVPDGEISEVIHETREVNGCRLRAGSVKVLYDNGVRSRWVCPTEVEDNLRPSPRPRPPISKSGRLMMETQGLFISSWKCVYVELTRGFLQWWADMEGAKNGDAPLGSVYTLGLEMNASAADASFGLRVSASGDHVYKFNVGDATAATVDWMRAFQTHASYCEDMHDYLMGAQFFAAQSAGLVPLDS